MAITVGQLGSTLDTIKQLDDKLNDLRMLVVQAKDLADKNWQVNIGTRSSLVISVTPAQQSALINQYDTFKSQLVTLFQQLP